jgi:hypothetical protein
MIGLSVAITAVPVLRESLRTVALPWRVWGAIVGAAIACTWWIEIGKRVRGPSPFGA